MQWSNSHLNVNFSVLFCMSCAVQNREEINCLLDFLCDRDWKFVAAVRSNCERHLPKSSKIIRKTQRKLTTCIKIPGKSLALTVCNPASPSDIFLALSGSALLRRGRFLMYWSTASEWPGTAHQMMTIFNKRSTNFHTNPLFVESRRCTWEYGAPTLLPLDASSPVLLQNEYRAHWPPTIGREIRFCPHELTQRQIIRKNHRFFEAYLKYSSFLRFFSKVLAELFQ